MRNPCPTCKGLGHRCKDDDPFGHIHDHEPPAPLCKSCGGRGSVEADVPVEPDEEPQE